MKSAHQRAKAPALVQRRLLDAAATIALSQGFASVTVQAVADTAGVTKGGLLHHFASEQHLLDAVFADLADGHEQDIATHMAGQPGEYGVFTRAYIETTLADITDSAHHARATLCVLAISDPRMRELWATRMHQLLDTHHATDGDIALAGLRFAADGYWLAEMIGSDRRDPSAMRGWLMAQLDAN